MSLEFHLPLILDLWLKSSAILLAAFGVGWLARKASAARRHFVWLAAFITLAILPLTLTIPPRWSWSWQRPAPTRPTISTTVPAAIHELPDSLAEGAPAQPVWRLPDWSVVAGGIWLAVALLLIVRQAAGFWRLHALRRRSSAITTGLAAQLAAEFGTVEIRESPLCAVPLTWGCVRPVVLLPVSASSWPETQLRAALTHELGHIARRDFLWRQLAQIVRAFFWPNPLVWFAVRALHRTQEQACDDLVLRRGTSPREYALQLLEAARSLAGPRFTLSHAVAMALPSTLEGRVRAIVDERRDRRTAGNWSRVAAAAAIAAAIAGSAFAGVKSSPPKPPAAPQVLIEAKFIEAPDDAIDPADFRGGLLFERADVLLKKLIAKKGVDILSAPRITTRSGQRAVVEIGRGEPGSPATGFKFDVLPSVRGTGPEINLELVTKIDARVGLRLGDGQPLVATRVLKTNVTLTSGRTCLCSGHAMKEGRTLLIAVTASIVDESALVQQAAESRDKIDAKLASVVNESALLQQGPKEPSAEPAPSPAKAGSDPYRLHIVPDATDFGSSLGNANVAPEDRRNVLSISQSEPVTKAPIEINGNSIRSDNGVVLAEGDVVFRDGTVKITGNTLRFDATKREVEVTGSGRIERGRDVATCEKIIYWLDTGKMRTEGRAKTVIRNWPAQ